MGRFGIGNRIERLEDDRFLTGRGRFMDDLVFGGAACAVFVRAPVAHAEIGNVDASGALAVPGVLCVFTAADLATDGINSLPTLATDWVELTQADGSPAYVPDRPLLAADRVRYGGEAIAMVIAESEEAALEGAEQVQVDLTQLGVTVETGTAHKKEMTQLWDGAPDNTGFLYHAGDADAAAKAFDTAATVVSLDLVNNRVVVNPLEARSAVGEYDGATGRYTLHCDSQHPYDVRKQVSGCIGVEPEMVRVVSPDVGGGFGIKYIAYPEHALVLWASRKLDRQIKWRSTRTEAFLCDCHARDLTGTASLALDADGRFLAMRADLNANLGAYASSHGPVCPTILCTLMMPGPYTMPVIAAEVRGVYTNTVPTDAYRGCGQPEALYLIERLVHAASDALGISQEDIRRRNFVPASAMPYTSATELEFDSGDFAANLSDALGASDWNGAAARKADAAGRGRLHGIGVSSYVEITGADTKEGTDIRFEEDGTVTLNVGTKSSGQGHETVFAQMLNEELGIPFDKINVRDGDTDALPHGGGTGGSRSMQMAGTAIHVGSEKVRAKAGELAAHLLEASRDDVAFEEGVFTIVGTDRSIGIMDVADAARDAARLPAGMEVGLDTMVVVEHEASTFPNGSHVCEVEVDPETGTVDVVGYWAVSDFGRVMNPMLLEGQIQGGVAQGIGQALREHTVFDADGQLMSGSFLDYCLPRADDTPAYEVGFNEVPCTTNALGVKGAGESGCIASLPAVMNALHDALKVEGVTHIDMPATPERVWRAIQDARAA